MRIWSEPYDSERHRNPMNNGWGAPVPTTLKEHLRAPALVPHDVLFVQVCGFTFEFHGREQIKAALDYYSQKILPSSRLAQYDCQRGDHRIAQRWSDRLPLRLRGEAKRTRVVKALERALKEWRAAG